MAAFSLPVSSVAKTDFRFSGACVFLAAKGDFSSFFEVANFAEADLAKISEMLLTDGDRRDLFSGDDFGTG